MAPFLLTLLLNNQNNNQNQALLIAIVDHKKKNGQAVDQDQIRNGINSGRYTESPSTWNG